MKQLSLRLFIGGNARNDDRKKAIKVLFLAFLFCCASVVSFGQITVVPASGGGAICAHKVVGGMSPAYTNLGPIIISEGAGAADFVGPGTNVIVLSTPTGWQFNPVLPTFTFLTGANITGVSATITSTALTININVTAGAAGDELTISGLQVQATSAAAASGNIYASSVSGVPTIGTGTGPGSTNFGTLALTPVVAPAVTVTPSPGSTICAGTNVTYTPTPVGGGPSPSYVWSLNGITVGFGSTYSNNSLATGSNVWCTMTSNGSCIVPGAVTSNTVSMTVNPVPAALTGVATTCPGTFTNLSSTTTGGAWSSTTPAIATVNASGRVFGATAGNALISYTVSGCAATTTVVVNTIPITPVITPATGAVCNGNILTMTASGTATPPVVIVNDFNSGISPWTVDNTGSTNPTSITVWRQVPDGFFIHYIYHSPDNSAFAMSNPDASGSTTIISSRLISPIFSLIGYSSASFSFQHSYEFWPSGDINVQVDISTNGGSSWSLLRDYKGANIGNSSNFIAESIPLNLYIGMPNLRLRFFYYSNYGYYWAVDNAIVTGTSSGVVPSWSPVTYLFSDAACTVPYVANTSTNTVYMKPTGVSTATAFTYTATASNVGCSSQGTNTITINPAPGALSGSSNICLGYTTALTNAVGGGTWSSSNTSVATVGLASGIVSGVAVGNSNITYTLAGGCYTVTTVTVYPAPSAISGSSNVCVGSSISLNASPFGGTWTSSSIALATVVSGTGVVTGASQGTVVITYALGAGCITAKSVTVNPVPSAISGNTSVCAGSSIPLSNTVAGGTWSSSNSSRATINVSTGVLSGASAGAVNITYTLAGNCISVLPVTIYALPAAIAGVTSVCRGLTTVLSNSVSGGVWSSDDNTVATVTPSTGIVSGVLSGTANITYTIGSSCVASVMVTVNPLPAAITGPPAVCSGSSIALTDITTGGTWSSSNTANATIDADGIVTGANAGGVNITYTLNTGCIATKAITVNPLPAAITGVTAVCINMTTNLSSTTPGGTWTSSNTSVATIVQGTGVVSGIASGTATITYALPTGCFVTRVVTVNSLPSAISGVANVCSGQTTILSNAVSGGTWSSGNVALASVNNSTGIVTGGNAGMVNITYTLGTSCIATIPVQVNPLSPITGINNVCEGLTTKLSDATPGGTWSSSNLSVATIHSTSGVISGLVSGISAISYTLPTGCVATTSVVVNVVPGAITGNTNICLSSTAILSDAGSGTWSSSNSSIAAVNVNTGSVLGIALGTATITYSLSFGCIATIPVVVNPLPAAITGASAVCVASTIPLTDLSPGGTWSSSNTSLATVNNVGMVTGVSAGLVTIIYTLPTGCVAIKNITVNPLPLPINGTMNVCVGLSAMLSSETPGGTWSSSNSGVATVFNSIGMVTGAAAGTATISYGIGTGCSIAASVLVNPLPAPVTGISNLCVGLTTSLSNATTGGTWSSSNTSVATILPSGTGLVTSVGQGTSIITYALPTGCINTRAVTVNALPGSVTGNTTICVNGTTILTNGGGGTWSSSNSSIASVVNNTGVVTGAAAGTVNITYTLSTGCIATVPVLVNPLPSVITGSTGICMGFTTNLSSTSVGGTWTSGSPSVAAVVSSGIDNGLVSSVSSGTAIITYTLPTGCGTVKTVTVNPLPGAIAGNTSVCAGLSTQLFNSGSGTWSSSNSSVATVVAATGVVTGAVAGNIIITYTLPTGCISTTAFSVNPLPSAISGASAVCHTLITTLSNATLGGTWSSSNTNIASVDVATGVLQGLAPGVATVTYTLGTGCIITRNITVNPLPATIVGQASMCVLTSITLSDATVGGTWSSNNSAIAAVGVSSGMVNAVAAGSVIITYKLNTGCIATKNITVNGLPPSITGSTDICFGSTSALSNISTGGTWSSSNTTVAIIGLNTGDLFGIGAGTSTVTYTVDTGCVATAVVTVNPLPAAISGNNAICVGQGTTFTNSSTPGTWSSSNTAIATVGASNGTVTGVAPGTATINYTLNTGCRSSRNITVNASPSAIAGNANICLGSTSSLSNSVSGGTWSSSNGTVAPVGLNTGVVAGGFPGNATISYMLPGNCAATLPVTVNNLPASIQGNTTLCVGLSSQMSNVTAGGTWSTSNTSIATVTNAGVIYGVAPGSVMVIYTMGTGCVATRTINVYASPGAITGTTTACAGIGTTLSNATAGGVWSSSNTFVALVDPATGAVFALTAGTSNISYSVSGTCTVGVPVVINPSPAAIAGYPITCVNLTTALSNAVTGGTWTSSSTSVATVTPATGIVRGVAAGTTTITYRLAGGCFSTMAVSVNPPPSAITGNTNLCIGTLTSLSNSVGGGTWSSSNTLVAQANAATGVITALSSGSAVITYAIVSGCAATVNVTVNNLPASIAGITTVCIGTTTRLSDATPGGTWSSANTSLATVGATTGIVTGVGAGLVTVRYTLSTGCSASRNVTVSPLPTAISGVTNVCLASVSSLSNGTPGGTWSSSNTLIASVDPSSGVVTGIAPGNANITYSLGAGCSATVPVSVISAPAPISGATTFCVGSISVLGNATSGGAWSSSNTSVAFFPTSSGVVSGLSAGTAVITYSIGTGCAATVTVTVNSLPSAITGNTNICVGTTTTLSNTATGGTWSSNNTTVVIVAGAGFVTGFAPGTATITYSPGAGCSAFTTVSVNPLPDVITGSAIVCVGATTLLSNATVNGTWSSSNTSVATVDVSSGLVSGIQVGTANITYTLPTGCIATRNITVSPFPSAISGNTTVCLGGTTILSNTVAGGTWTTSATTVAMVGVSSGVVTGMATGPVSISYSIGSGCVVSVPVNVISLPPAITGNRNVCIGSATILSNAAGPGTWTSAATSITIDAATGVVTGLAAGTAVISFTAGTGCTITASVIVHPLPSAITGAVNVCAGSFTTLSNSGGGTWSSSDLAIATIGLTSGILSGVSTGTVEITYTLGTGCVTTTSVTIIPLPQPISGTATICSGVSSALSNSSTGGTWSSSNSFVATIGLTSGVATGALAGNTVISYRLGSGCAVSTTLTVNALPNAISGVNKVCEGQTTSLSSAGGGFWLSSDIAVASVGAGTGIVTGNDAGTAVITYTLGTGCTALTTVTVNPLPAPIAGTANVCIGSVTPLTNTTTGGTWSSGTLGVATVLTSSGLVSGVAAGSSVITYKLPTGCQATIPVTVHPLPGTISGTRTLCAGAVTALGNTGGGTWSSSNSAMAAVNVSSGLVSGISAGTARITYTLGTGCIATATVTVYPLPADITGFTGVCIGSTTTLSNITNGGTWSSGAPGIALVNITTGVVSGIAQGNAPVTFTLTTGCIAVTTVTVNALPSVISGNTGMCIGAATVLSNASGGGAWSSGNTAVATVDPTSGVVSGIALGTSRITYLLGTGCIAVTTVTVNPLPSAITGIPNLCVGLTTNLTGAGGGTWSSDNISVATVGLSNGIVSGAGMGTATITYRLPTGCATTRTVTVKPVPTAITGTPAMCAGSFTTLSNSVIGGTWSSSNPVIAPVGINTGVVNGIAPGTAIITYNMGASCYALANVTVQTVPSAITGPAAVCLGSSVTLSSSPAGGAWVSNNPGTASVDAATGVVTGIAPGVTVISYSLGSGCTVTRAHTVHMVAPVTGNNIICAGETTMLSNPVAGGTWSSGNTNILAVSSSGVVSGISGGLVHVTYTLGTGCASSLLINVNPSTPVLGSDRVCLGSSILLNNATAGGSWSSSDPLVASITSAGVLTGVMTGTVTIRYTLPTGCISARTVSVNPIPPPIAGSNSVCVGGTIYLSNAISGGTWSHTAPTGILGIGLTTGAITGLAVGSQPVTYLSPMWCRAVTTITVQPPPSAITGPLSICQGSMATYTSLTTGGLWSTGNTSIATIDPFAGVLTGVAPGVAVVSYTTGPGCTTTFALTVHPAPPPITGVADICAGGATTVVSNAAAGGTWTSTVVTVSPAGVVTGFGTGMASITYTLPTGCYTTAVLFVNPLPSGITGGTDVCIGSSTTLNSATPGGVWTTANTAVATVNPMTGGITGITAGTAVITYTIGTGCMVAAIVTVHPLPPAITGAASVCVADAVTLSNALHGGSWSSGNTGVAVIGASSGIVTGIAAGTVNITYTSAAGCSITAPFTVNALPVGVTGTNSVCLGGNTTLSDYPAGGTWSSASPSIATVHLTSGVVTGMSVSVTTLTYTIGTGCRRTVPFTVHPLPPAITGAGHLCSGSTITLNNAAAGGTWISGDGSVATVGYTTGVVTGVAASSTAITYTLPTGCRTAATVFVDPLPFAFAVTGGGTFCALDSGRHIGLSGSVAGFTYRVYRGTSLLGIFAGTGAPLDFGLYTIPGSYSVMAVNNTTGCTTGMSGSATIIVTPSVTPTVTVNTSGLCAGDIIIFTATGLNVGTAPSCVWKVNGVNSGTGNPFNYIPANGDAITCIVTGNAACATSQTATATVVVSLTPKQTPLVSITAAPGETVCTGTSVTYVPTPVYGGLAPVYKWRVNGVLAATAPSYSFVPAHGDSIFCTMISNYACLLTDSARSNKITMSVAAYVSPTVTVTADPATGVAVGQTVTFTATVAGPVSGYQWYRNHTAVSGAVASVWVSNNFSDGDTVSCVVSGGGQCSTGASDYVIVTVLNTGVAQVGQLQADIKLVPNPNKGTFTIRGALSGASNALDNEMVLEVTDMLGQMVYRGTATARAGKINETVTLDKKLANGMYMLTVRTANSTTVFHFVVEQ